MRYALPVVILLGVLAGAPALAAPAPERGAGELAIADADPVAMLNRLLLEAQPQGENAWPLYEAALREFLHPKFDTPDGRGEIETTFRIWRTAGLWERENHDLAAGFVTEIRALLDALVHAAGWPGFQIRYDPVVPEVILENPLGISPLAWRLIYVGPSQHEVLSVLERVASLNQLALRVALHQQDWGAAAIHLRAGLRVAAHFSYQRTLPEWEFGARVAADHLEEIRVAVNNHRIPEPHARLLLGAINESRWHNGRLESVALAAVPMHAYLLHSYIQRHGGEQSRSQPQAYTLIMRRAMHNAAVATLNDRGSIIDAAQDALIALGDDGVTRYITQKIRDSVAAMQQIDRVTAELVATRLMLGIEIHFSRTSKWPESMDELPGAEGAIEPGTGLPFRYQRIHAHGSRLPYELRLPSQSPQAWKWRHGDLLSKARR